jgi:hypothetical protein
MGRVNRIAAGLTPHVTIVNRIEVLLDAMSISMLIAMSAGTRSDYYLEER